jgi:hypothetical protein
MQHLEAPRAWPNKAIKYEGHGSVSRGDWRGSRVTMGGPAVVASTGVQEQRANRQSNFGPTCRLVSSPEVGPGATVGTMNHSTPYYSMKARCPYDDL